MARFRLSLEYVGTRYRGWQIQKNARTVQGELHDAVREVSGRTDFESYGSGRTDAGVHALQQVAHLDLETRLTPESLRRALNEALPADINVLAAEKVSRQFHARHGTCRRSSVSHSESHGRPPGTKMSSRSGRSKAGNSPRGTS